jgi:hypothetical protein
MSVSAFDGPALRALALSETGFVFDPRTGHSYSVNGTGLAVLAALREGLSLPDVVRRVQEKFESADAAVEEDVAIFVQRMRDLGLGVRPGTAG